VGTGGNGTAGARGQKAAGAGNPEKSGGRKTKEGEDSEGQTQYAKRRRILFRTRLNVTHACTGARLLIYMCIYDYVNTHTHTHMPSHIYINTHTHIYIYDMCI